MSLKQETQKKSTKIVDKRYKSLKKIAGDN